MSLLNKTNIKTKTPGFTLDDSEFPQLTTPFIVEPAIVKTKAECLPYIRTPQVTPTQVTTIKPIKKINWTYKPKPIVKRPVVNSKPIIRKPLIVCPKPQLASQNQYKVLANRNGNKFRAPAKPYRHNNPRLHRIVKVAARNVVVPKKTPAMKMEPRMFNENYTTAMPASNPHGYKPVSNIRNPLRSHSNLKFRKNKSYIAKLENSPKIKQSSRKLHFKLVKSSEEKERDIPKRAMPRMWIRPSHVKVLYKGAVSRRPRTDDVTWQKTEMDNIDIQVQLPSISMTTITKSIANQLKETSIGKQLKWLVIMNLASGIMSIIALTYSLFTNKSKVSATLSSIAIALQLSVIVADVYAILKFQKLTNSASIEEGFTHFIEEKLKDIATHVMATEEDGYIPLVQQVDLTRPQTADELVTLTTDKLCNTLNNSRVTPADGIVLTNLPMPEKGFNLTHHMNLFLNDDTIEDAGLCFAQTVVHPYTEMDEVRKVEHLAHVHEVEYNPEEDTSGHLLRKLFGNSETLAADIKTHYEAQNRLMQLSTAERVIYEAYPCSKIAIERELFTGGFTLVKSFHVALLAGVDVIYTTPQRSYLIKTFDKFIPFKKHDSKLVLVTNGAGLVKVYNSQINIKNTSVTTYTRRVIDVLVNMYNFESEQAYPNAETIEHYLRCIQYVQQQHNAHVGHVAIVGGQVHAQDPSEYVLKAIRIGIALLAVVLGSVEMFSGDDKKSCLARFASGRNVKKAVMETGNEVLDLTNEVMWELFGIALSPEAVASEQFTKSYDALVDFNQRSHVYYVNNVQEFYKASKMVRETRERLRTLSSKGKDVNLGLSNLIRSISVQLDKADEKINQIIKTIKNSSTRVQTQALMLYGAHGAGKSSFATRCLIPALAERLGEHERVYQVNFGKNEFWPEYQGQAIGLYDEFLGAKDEDPMIAYMNALHSPVPFNMEGAFIKEQYTNLKAFIYCANQPYVNLLNKLSAEASKGFYSRFLAIHFVNTRRVANQLREEIPRVDYNDSNTYELRQYEFDIDDQHTYPMISDPTVGKEAHYDQATDSYHGNYYNCTATNLRYRLLTISQYVNIAMRRIQDAENTNQQARTIQTRNHVRQFLSTQTVAPKLEDIVKHCLVYAEEPAIVQAYNELYDLKYDELSRIHNGNDLVIAMRDAKFIPRGVQVDGGADPSMDHFVTAMVGTPGTGKSVLAKKLGTDINRILQIPVYEFKGKLSKAAASVTYPGIIILHDCCYDEIEFINFYDTVPKPSLFLSTSNCSLEKATVDSNDITNMSNGIPLSALTTSQGSLPTRMWRSVINTLLSKANASVTRIINPTVIDERLEQPGWGRRFGVGGALWYGNTLQRRPMHNSLVVQNSTGYRSFIRDVDGGFTETNHSELLDKIVLDYCDYVNKQGKLEVKYTELDTVNKLFNGAEADVYIRSANVKSLIALTRDTAALSSAALMGALSAKHTSSGNQVRISERVRTSKFPFSATEYAIDEKATITEAADIGKKMYRQLMYGGADLTVRVECADFIICGINQTIYVVPQVKIPRSNITLVNTPTGVSVHVIQEVENMSAERTLMDITHEEYGRWRATGIDYAYVREFMSHTHAQEFVHVFNRAEIPEGAQATYLKMQYKYHTAESVIKSRFDFEAAKAKLVESYVWSIMTAVIGLIGVGILLTAIVKYFTGSDKKERVVTGYITQNDGVESQYKAHIRTYIHGSKKLGDDFGQRIEIGVTCPNITAVDMPTLKKALSAAFDLEFTQAGCSIDDNELVDITIQSYDEEDRKKGNKKKANKKMKVQAIHSKSGIYTGPNPNVKKQVPGAKFKTIVLTNPQGSEQHEAIIGKVHGQMLAIKNQCTGMSLKGVAWREHFVLSSAHVYTDAQSVYTGTNLSNGEIYVLKPVALIKDEDLIVFKLADDHRKLPLFPNITKYFQSDLNRVTCQHVIYRRVESSEVVDNNGEMITKIHTIDRIGLSTTARLLAPVEKKESNFTLNTDYYNYVTYTDVSGVLAEHGDCGTPVYGITKGAPVVIGFHFGSNGKNQFVTSITREQLDELYTHVENPIADSPTEIQGKIVTIIDSEDAFKDALDTIEYTGPDGVKETVIVPKYTAKLIVESSEDIDPNKYYDCMDGMHTRILGTTKVGKLSRLNKPKYSQTIYSTEVADYIPNVMANSIMNPHFVEDKSQLVCNANGSPSILMTQMNKFNNQPTSELDVRVHYLSKVRPILKKYYENIYGNITQRNLTELEIINGLVINPRDPLFGCLEGLNHEGAVGLDVARQFPGVSTIGDLLQADPGIKSPTGKTIYVFKPTPAAMYVKSLMIATQMAWAEGQRCEGIVSDNLKAELLKESKIKTGRSRAFESYPVHTTLATRAVMGTMNASFKKLRSVGHGQIGLDRPMFTEIFNRFRTIGVYGEHGDFENWDKNMTAEEVYAAGEFLIAMRFPHDDGKVLTDPEIEERRQFRNTVRCILDSIVKSICIADGTIYVKNKGQNSGCVLTTLLNCIVNDQRRIAVIMYLVDKHNERVSGDIKLYHQEIIENLSGHVNSEVAIASLETNKNLASTRLNLSAILKMTDWVNCGDDKASVIATEILWLLNFVNYNKAYAFVWGQVYGSPHKDGRIEAVTRLQELNFVSRDFTYDVHQHIVWPTLKMTSIDRLFHWITSHTCTQYHANLLASFSELALYPEDVYNHYCQVVSQIINPTLEDQFGPGSAWEVPDYNSLRAEFIEQSRFTQSDAIVVTARQNELVSSLNRATKKDALINLTQVSRQPAVGGPVKKTKTQFDLNFINIHGKSEEMEIPQEKFEEVLKTISGLEIKISGMPAYNWSQKMWSLSCEPIDIDDDSLQSHFNKLKVKFHGSDVVVINVNGKLMWRHQIKISSPSLAPSRFPRVHYNHTTLKFNPQGLPGAMSDGGTSSGTLVNNGDAKQLMKEKPEESAQRLGAGSGGPLPGREQFYEKSTFRKAHEFQYLRSVKVAVGSTINTTIIELKASECINNYMKAAIYGDEFVTDMNIEVRIDATTNTGISGVVAFGSVWETKSSYTQNDLNQKPQDWYNLAQPFEVVRSFNLMQDKNMSSRIPISELNNHTAKMVGLVLGDVLNTFNNSTLYAQFHLYTRFAGIPKTLNKTLPSFEAGGNVPGVSDLLLSTILGDDAKIVTDGSLSFKELGADGYKPEAYLIQNSFRHGWTSKVVPSTETIIQDLKAAVHTADELVSYEVADDKLSAFMEANIFEGSSNMNCSVNFKTNLKVSTDVKGKTYMRVIDPVTILAKERVIPATRRHMASVDLKDNGKVVMYSVSTQPDIITKEDQDGLGSAITLSDITMTADGRLGQFNIKDYSQYWTEFQVQSLGYTYHLTSGIEYDFKAGVENMEFIRSKSLGEYALVGGMSNIPASVSALPTGCKRVIAVRGSGKVPSVVKPLDYSPTMYGSIDMSKQFARHFDPTKIYEARVVDTVFKQLVGNFIIHGPEQIVFLRTVKEEEGMYSMCKYAANELQITSVTELTGAGVLPTSNMTEAWLDRASQQYKQQLTRTRAVISMTPQGAAMAAGAISGGGQGLSQYLQNEQNMKMLMTSGDLRRELQELIGEQGLKQLDTQLAAQAALQQSQQSHELTMKGLRSPAMQSQLATATGEAANQTAPKVQFVPAVDSLPTEDEDLMTNVPSDWNGEVANAAVNPVANARASEDVMMNDMDIDQQRAQLLGKINSVMSGKYAKSLQINPYAGVDIDEARILDIDEGRPAFSRGSQSNQQGRLGADIGKYFQEKNAQYPESGEPLAARLMDGYLASSNKLRELTH